MLRSAGFTFIAKLLAALLNFVIVIIISRFLGPAERGICSWYGVIIAICLVFSEAIAGPAAGFLLLKYPQHRIRYISYVWAIITSMVVTSIFFAFGKITTLEWILLALLCWLNAANSIHLHLLLARQQFIFFSGQAVLLQVVVIIYLLISFKTGHLSKICYLYALLVAWTLGCLMGIFLLNKFDDDQLKSNSIHNLIKDGFHYGLSNQAGHLTSLLNNRLVFFILPASVLGIYSNALSLAEASTMIPGSMGQVMYASLLHNNDPVRSARMAIVNWWLTIFSLAIVLLLVLLLPDSFYQLLFGKQFSGIKSYLIYLCIAIVFYGCYLICSYWQSAQGRFINNFYASLAGLAVNATVSLLFYLSGIYTIYAGVFALTIGFLVIFIVSLYQFANKNGGVKTVLKIPNLMEINNLFKK